MTKNPSNQNIGEECYFLLIEDHEVIVRGVVDTLQETYPDVKIVIAKTAQEAQSHLERQLPDVIISDLSIPESSLDDLPLPDTGIQLLRKLLAQYPTSNFVVQTAHVKTLIRIKPSIDAHQGGFVVADKRLNLPEIIRRIDWSLQGLIYTPPEMRAAIEIKPIWFEILKLAFQEGLQDKAIAQSLNITERMVSHHWAKIKDALEVYPEDGKNPRFQTALKAKKEGLID